MFLDPRTITIMTALSHGLLSGWVFVSARLYPPTVRGIVPWGWACVAQALGWLLLGEQGLLPDALSQALAITLIVGSVALGYQAVRLFQEEQPRWLFTVALVGVTALMLAFFTGPHPSFVARSIFSTGVVAVLALLSGYTLLPIGRRPPSPGYWLFGSSLYLSSVLLALRVFYLLYAHPATAPFTHAGFWQMSVVFGGYVVTVCTTFGFILLCHDRMNLQNALLATLDPLTGIANRRQIDDLLARVHARTRAAGRDLSLLLLDIDHFKEINDTHGHRMGDDVLREFASLVAAQLRPRDHLGRYGGEEFLMLLPDTTQEHALRLAEELRQWVAADHGLLPAPLTVSIGVATDGGEHGDCMTLLAAADRALYTAKALGRNRVVGHTTLQMPQQSSA